MRVEVSSEWNDFNHLIFRCFLSSESFVSASVAFRCELGHSVRRFYFYTRLSSSITVAVILFLHLWFRSHVFGCLGYGPTGICTGGAWVLSLICRSASPKVFLLVDGNSPVVRITLRLRSLISFPF